MYRLEKSRITETPTLSVTCHISPVTFQLSLTPTGTKPNNHKPSPADSPIVYSRMVLDLNKHLNKSWTKPVVKIVVTIKPIMQFSCVSRCSILRTIYNHSVYKERQNEVNKKIMFTKISTQYLIFTFGVRITYNALLKTIIETIDWF